MPKYQVSESTSLQNPDIEQNFFRKHFSCVKTDGLNIISILFFIVSIFITFILGIQIQSGISEVSPDGYVASDDAVCSEAGARMIRKGGSAVDAAVATLLCLSVTQPHIVGPGGGGLMMIYDHKKNITKIIDFMIQFPTESSLSGIPGFLEGLKRTHELNGILPWKDLFGPAINLSRNGFIVSESLKEAVDKIMNQQKTRENLSANFRAKFFPAGVRLTKGQLFSRQKFADFLEEISDLKFEESNITKYTEEFTQDLETFIPELKNYSEDYKVIERKPIGNLIHNVSITTVGSPFGGSRLLNGLRRLQELNISSQTDPKKLYGAFVEVFQEDLNESSAGRLLKGANGSHKSSQIAVVDTFDLYVSAFAELGDTFGSGFMTNRGVIMNGLSNIENVENSSQEFSGRRISSSVPVVAAEPGNVCGQRVLFSAGEWDDLLQTLTQMIFRNHDLIPAVSEPRVSIGRNSNVVLVNDFDEKVQKIPTAVRDYLKNEMGLELQGLHHPSSVNGISKIKNKMEGYSDVRGKGKSVRVNEEAKEL